MWFITKNPSPFLTRGFFDYGEGWLLGVPSAVTVRVGVIVAVAVTAVVDAELVVDVPVAALPPTTI